MARAPTINFLVLVKDDGQRFIFTFDDQSVPELERTFGRFAGDPELAFTWYDAAVLTKRCRAMMQRPPNPD